MVKVLDVYLFRREVFKSKTIKFINKQKSNFMTSLTEILPIGTIVPFALKSIPKGWLPCDGHLITDNFAELKQLLGDRTPDLRGRTLVGANKEYLLLKFGGEKEVILSEENIPAHSHTYIRAISVKGGAYDHEASRANDYKEDSTSSYGEKNPKSFSIMQPYIAINYIIYAGSSC